MTKDDWLALMRYIEHALDCACWHALNSSELCDHGYEVCPLCDPCHCHEGEVIVLDERPNN